MKHIHGCFTTFDVTLYDEYKQNLDETQIKDYSLGEGEAEIFSVIIQLNRYTNHG
jgi:hypothetical protein